MVRLLGGDTTTKVTTHFLDLRNHAELASLTQYVSCIIMGISPNGIPPRNPVLRQCHGKLHETSGIPQFSYSERWPLLNFTGFSSQWSLSEHTSSFHIIYSLYCIFDPGVENSNLYYVEGWGGG